VDLQNFKKVMKEDKKVYMLAEWLNGMEEAEQYWLDRIEGIMDSSQGCI
jgi:hypothetical protein